MEKFQMHDMVETIDDVVRGKVIGFDGDMVTIKTLDGFQMQFEPNELVKVETLTEWDRTPFEDPDLEGKAFGQKKNRLGRKKKKSKIPAPMEVDLHIEKLIMRPGQMSVGELLEFQLETARKQLEFAMNKKISTVVFIHGKGAGVLRSSLHVLFRKYPNLLYRDASFRKYGLGATEVLITYPKELTPE